MIDRFMKSTLALIAAGLIAACSSSDNSSLPNGGTGATTGNGGSGGHGGNGTAGFNVGAGGLVTGTAGFSTGTAGSGVAGLGAAGFGTGTAGFGAGGAGAGGTLGAGGTSAGGTSAGGAGGVGMSGGGYLVSGAWHGYVYDSASGTGSTISPKDFTMNTANQPFCAMGSVAPMADYSGTAIVGFNLNQAAGSMTFGTVTPTANGIIVNVTNTGASPLRVQLQGPNGATDATQRWCAPLTGTGDVTIPYSSFNTACWDGSGTAYAGEPIAAAQILVPGTNTDAVPFNFCLNSISDGTPVTGGTGGAGGMGAGGSTGSAGSSAGGTSGAGTAGSAAGGTTGTAGSSAGGTGGAATGGASGAAGTGGAGPDNGYETNGTWKGYAFTATSGTGTTITPADFSKVKSNAPVCASGSVAASTSAVAIVGINLNQPMGKNPPASTVTPTMDGIVVSVTNTGGSPLRMQIQGPNGATDATDRWCAPVPGTGGFIPWTAFNTACWDNTGTYYKNQPITSALVMVPGVATGTTAFDFCVVSVGEGDNTTTGGTTGCDVNGSTGSGTGTLTGQFDARLVTGASGLNYYVQNNVWGDASSNQTLTFNGVSFTINQQSANDSTSGHPVSFPSVFIGSNGGHTTSGSNLPRAISAMKSVPTAWSNNAGSVSGTYNATYDVWFSSGAGGDNGASSPSGGYLMVWFYKPASAQPIGSVQASGVSISGKSWDVWYGGQQNGKPVVSYVATSPLTSYSFDLKAFIDDATSKRSGTITSGMALTNVFAGFEIWSGGAGLKTNNFCAIVN